MAKPETTPNPVLSHTLEGAFVPVMDVASATEIEELRTGKGELIQRAGYRLEGRLRGGHALAEGLPTWMRPGAQATWRMEFARDCMQFDVTKVQVNASNELVEITLTFADTPMVKTWRA